MEAVDVELYAGRQISAGSRGSGGYREDRGSADGIVGNGVDVDGLGWLSRRAPVASDQNADNSDTDGDGDCQTCQDGASSCPSERLAGDSRSSAAFDVLGAVLGCCRRFELMVAMFSRWDGLISWDPGQLRAVRLLLPCDA